MNICHLENFHHNCFWESELDIIAKTRLFGLEIEDIKPWEWAHVSKFLAVYYSNQCEYCLNKNKIKLGL